MQEQASEMGTQNGLGTQHMEWTGHTAHEMDWDTADEMDWDTAHGMDWDTADGMC